MKKQIPEKIFIGSQQGFEKFKHDVNLKIENNLSLPKDFPCIAVCTIINENDGYCSWNHLDIKYVYLSDFKL